MQQVINQRSFSQIVSYFWGYNDGAKVLSLKLIKISYLYWKRQSFSFIQNTINIYELL